MSTIYVYFCYQKFNTNDDYSQPVQIVIPPQISLEKISQLLFEDQVIDSAFQFKWFVRLKGFARDVKAGEYLFPAARSMQNVMEQLINGKTVQHFVTIPEGLTSKQCIEIINAAPYLNNIICDIPPEGILLPETYSYSYGESRLSVMTRMQLAMDKTINQLWCNRSQNCTLQSQLEALTLASIVEKETALPAERPDIAAVFLNRLRLKMPLQSDPTVIYALEQSLQQSLSRDLTKSDLKFAHPYNTYYILGLPPGPICNPSVESLKAVLNPLSSDKLFFVADGTGGHVFAKTLHEHQQNHRNWRILRKKF